MAPTAVRVFSAHSPPYCSHILSKAHHKQISIAVGAGPGMMAVYPAQLTAEEKALKKKYARLLEKVQASCKVGIVCHVIRALTKSSKCMQRKQVRKLHEKPSPSKSTSSGKPLPKGESAMSSFCSSITNVCYSSLLPCNRLDCTHHIYHASMHAPVSTLCII